jgi:hypothetical protein
VTVCNTLLTRPDAATALNGKAIDKHVILKIGDLVPFSKTIAVLPVIHPILLHIDLRHVIHQVPLTGNDVPASELFAKTTLEITNRHDSHCWLLLLKIVALQNS